MIEIKSGGVTCLSDYGVYDPNYSKNLVKIMSIYGSPQQVKAIFGLLSTTRKVEANIGGETLSLYRSLNSMRFKGFSIGYGKQWGIIWDETISENTIIYTNPAERTEAFVKALSKRKIPYDASILEDIIKILTKNGHAEKLEGWGGAGGYTCSWNDDAICDNIARQIFGLKRTALRAA